MILKSSDNSNAQKVTEFMLAFNQDINIDINSTQTVDVLSLLALRLRLVNEERSELQEAVDELIAWLAGDLNHPLVLARAESLDCGVISRADGQRAAFVDVIDALTDILYVTYGFFAAVGVDADAAFSIVHESNMSKLGADGLPIYRPDGKVLKGPDYVPPDFSGLISA